MAEKKKEKLAAAVLLGRLGGKQTAKKYGKKLFQKMARKAHATKVARYGESNFYSLIRFGYKPTKMTKTEQEEALAKIVVDRSRRQKRETQ